MKKKYCQDYTTSYQQSLYQNPCFLNTQFGVMHPSLIYFHFRTVIEELRKHYFKPLSSMKYLLSEQGTMLSCSAGRTRVLGVSLEFSQKNSGIPVPFSVCYLPC